jgi:predicted nucleic acid-binding protein
VKPVIIVDTGPLIAFLNRHDKYHQWTKDQFERLKPPFYTCESVLSEACFLLRHQPLAQSALLEYFCRELVIITFELSAEIHHVKKLMAKYQTVPMSLADACLVRMSEQHAENIILTLDNDFKVYRKHGRHVIQVLMPD